MSAVTLPSQEAAVSAAETALPPAMPVPVSYMQAPAASLLLILFGGAVIGFAPILVRISETGPLATGAWRMGFAALVLLPFALANRQRDAASHRGRGLWPICLAGLLFALDLCGFHLALTATSIAHATLIVNLAPVVVLSAGVLFFSERCGPLKLAGLVLALGGAAAMTLARSGVEGTLSGNLFAAGSMVAYAFYLIAVKQARRFTSAVNLMAWSSLISCLFLFAFAWAAGETLLPQSLAGFVVLFALGVIVHAVGQGVVAIGMREAPVGLTSILMLMQPLVAAIAAWLIFEEKLGPVEMAGAAGVLAGIVLASRPQGKPV